MVELLSIEWWSYLVSSGGVSSGGVSSGGVT